MCKMGIHKVHFRNKIIIIIIINLKNERITEIEPFETESS